MVEKRTAEHKRLADSAARKADWKNWGPYLSERAWGTVREDYSANGDAWGYFPHNHARSRAFRWNEDGLGGFCNRFQNVCLAVALWNERDPILKERFFGLSGEEGNHGEDVKEYYFYLDGTPSHSYMKMLYKYPQVEFPYARLVEESQRRDRLAREYELVDALRETFSEGRYFDVFIEYAKAGEEDILCRITAINRGPDPAPIHILPHLWFRNTWSWGYKLQRPVLEAAEPIGSAAAVRLHHRHLGKRWWYVVGAIHPRLPSNLANNDLANRRLDRRQAAKLDRDDTPLHNSPLPSLLFTENDTNDARLYGAPNPSPYVKDGIHEAIVNGKMDCVNPQGKGTKVAAHLQAIVNPGEAFVVHVHFSPTRLSQPFDRFDALFDQRLREADEFYAALLPGSASDDEKLVMRQAFAGLLWSKQFYHYSVELWLRGDPALPPPPKSRLDGRNARWSHLYNLDVLSMPDKWEYPWYAAWDLAFHTVPLAMLDPEWAKRQLVLLLREWYMHPNGQLPAYEWNFSDVNPPVHAWAAWQVYQIDRQRRGHADTAFLERIFHKLLLNFTWWVNRKDVEGSNVFEGGFLGLDNIGVFDRSKMLPGGSRLEQADGTAWMAMYCLNMLCIALELARTLPVYEDVATKFFEHFIYIANAFTRIGHSDMSLWDEQDGFFYDVLHDPDGNHFPLKVRSFVGLIPLFAVQTLEPEQLQSLPRFRRRMEWFIKYRPDLVENVASLTELGAHGHTHLSVVGRDELVRILERLFDPEEFLSQYGLRALSRYHQEHPYTFVMDGETHTVRYEPAESSSPLYGGNSNWRGPIWFPVNYLLVESLRKFGHHYGDNLKAEFPRGSGTWLNLDQAAAELSHRLVCIFLQDAKDGGRRPVFGDEALFQNDPQWRDHLLFYEYFHGDNGAGIGASHQTGWTALVARLIQEIHADKE